MAVALMVKAVVVDVGHHGAHALLDGRGLCCNTNVQEPALHERRVPRFKDALQLNECFKGARMDQSWGLGCSFCDDAWWRWSAKLARSVIIFAGRSFFGVFVTGSAKCPARSIRSV